MSERPLLDRLCAARGIATEFSDCRGDPVRVSAKTKEALLAAMGVEAGDESRLPEVLAELEARDWRRILPPVQVLLGGEPSAAVPVTIPRRLEQAQFAWSLIREDGAATTGRMCFAELPLLAERVIREESYRRFALMLPAELPWGYHELRLEQPERALRCATRLIVAPGRCYLPPAVEGDRRIFGLTLPLYAVRSRRNWGIGDFTDLRSLVDYAAEQGAALIRLTPLHALWPLDPARCNPYEPANRCFYNALYLDVEAIPEFGECQAAQERVADVEFQARLRSLRAEDRVNYREVAEIKRSVFEQLFAYFRQHHLDAFSSRGAAFLAYREQRGEPLREETLFAALAEHFFLRQAASGWTEWPPEYRDPHASAVRAFADQHADRLDFYAYLHWQAELQLADAGRRAWELGLGVGLCPEIVLNAAADGGEVWSRQALCARSARSGWPADPCRPEGATSTSAPYLPEALREAAYAPFIAALTENMRHAGAVSLHGVAGLLRQFWIPCGAAAREGSYVAYPADDLLAIVTLESHRNRCMVLGSEDVTTAESTAMALARRGILPCRSFLAQLESVPEAPAPQEYPADAVLLSTASDGATVSGFWLGRDLEERTALRLFDSEAARHAAIIARAEARARLLVALERQGLLPPEVGAHSVPLPEMTLDLVRAVYLLLADTPARIVLLRLEDALGQIDAPHLPGGPADYPQWRRMLPLLLEEWRSAAGVAALVTNLAGLRGGAPQVHAAPIVAGAVVFAVPRATYRLQFHLGFTFRHATELLTYLDELGISHCYASPYLKARPGSSHGYDIVDHGALNPEIGSLEDFERFVRELERRDMGHILDLVPNHMGVMGSDNAWWLDVLENGEASDYAAYFDIDWSPVKDDLRGKILLPVLGSSYGAALENGEIQLSFDPEQGTFCACYGSHRFPVDPREYPRILGHRIDLLEAALGSEPAALAEFQSLITAFGHLPGRWRTAENERGERNRDKQIHKQHLASLCRAACDIAQFIVRNVAEFNGSPGIPASFDHLHELLQNQAYRLAYWRVAADDINYRRFFDINDLAALRMENEAVFEATHRFVLGAIAKRHIHGLRIDHPDGLFDPEEYFRRLQKRIQALAPCPSEAAGADVRRFYLVVEKILARDERLPEHWPVHGTTGYEFTGLVNGLFVWPGAEKKLARFYRTLSGFRMDFGELLYQAKRLILRVSLSSELTVLANRLGRIAESDRRTRDYSLNSLREALREILACFPVYRTYITGREIADADVARIEQAVDQAKKRSPAGDLSVYDFVRDVLLTVQAQGKNERYADDVISFVMKFQQVTGPVMAKGLEDTTFYRYLRLVSLNEVGGDPRRFAVSLEEFHRANQERARFWPHALLSTSTHDSKRAEDVRARINVLSELVDEWVACVQRWTKLNRGKKSLVEGAPAPSRNDEYLIYQTLLGTWPWHAPDEAGIREYRQRLEGYLRKAVREAKLHSSWLNPDPAYEQAVEKFLGSLLERSEANLFWPDFLAFQTRVVRHGIYNGLAQLLLKLTAPGVPDVYQGSELWDFSLVDPDNRRPVDYALRRSLLERIKPWDGLPAEQLATKLRELQDNPQDGCIKLYTLRRVLRLRRQHAELFRRGGYQPLAGTGHRAEHLCAFLRSHGARVLLVVVPRWTARLLDRPGTFLDDAALWGDTRIPWPASVSGDYRNVFTQQRIPLRGLASIPAATLFARFPIALLEKLD